MGRDKALLKYHGRPQVRHVVDLLRPFCAQVYVSSRREQARSALYQGLSQVHDAKKYAGQGPLAGILTAMGRFPKRSWIILACDLPYVDAAVLKKLVEGRDPKRMATAYLSRVDGLPEPLCAIYEPRYRSRLAGSYKKGLRCPRKIMINSRVKLLKQDGHNFLTNINDPDEFKRAQRTLSTRER
jgi:molybdenum cofactor guanylyltransferase